MKPEFLRNSILFAAVGSLAAASGAMGNFQTWVGGSFPSGFNALWSNPANWDPSGVPLPTDTVAVSQFSAYANVDIDATVANLNVSNLATVGAINSPLAANKTLNVTGTTSIANFGLIQATDGAHYTLGTLLQQSNSTLLYSGVIGAGGGISGSPNPSIVEWRGANVVRNEASIELGPNGFLRDQDTGLDALRNFSQNGGLFGVEGRTYVTPGAFSNFSSIQVGTQFPNEPLARFEVGGPFANFNSSTGVLTGGQIVLKGFFDGRAEFAFPGANIRTLAPFTYLTLEGNAAIVDSNTGLNGLRNLANLGGDFSVANAFGITPTDGTLQQTAGNLHIRTNGHITVTGDLHQYQDAAIVLDDDARLTVTGNSTVEAQFIMPSPYDSVAHPRSSSGELVFEPSSSLQGSGALEADLMYLRGEVRPGSTPAPGESRGAAPLVAGRIDLDGLVFMSGDTDVSIVLAGPTPDTQYSTIHHTGSQMFVSGTLRLLRPDGYIPDPADRFTIIQSPDLEDYFFNPVGQDLGDNQFLALQYLPDRLLVGRAIPGDASLNGVVDIDDFAVLASHFNEIGVFTWREGNFTDDDMVNIDDFAGLASNFNRSLLDQPRPAAVPEPSALGVLLAGSLSRRRRTSVR